MRRTDRLCCPLAHEVVCDLTLLAMRKRRFIAGLCGLILVCAGAAPAFAQYRFDYWDHRQRPAAE
jgi:hypothetical protein